MRCLLVLGKLWLHKRHDCSQYPIFIIFFFALTTNNLMIIWVRTGPQYPLLIPGDLIGTVIWMWSQKAMNMHDKNSSLLKWLESRVCEYIMRTLNTIVTPPYMQNILKWTSNDRQTNRHYKHTRNVRRGIKEIPGILSRPGQQES